MVLDGCCIFGLWKVINVAVLFCIYVPVPLWFAADALRLFRPWGQRTSLGEMIVSTIVFVSWLTMFALYNDPEPSARAITSIDGSKHFRVKDTFESNVAATFNDYLAYLFLIKIPINNFANEIKD